jgi:hypothetical protein
MELRNRIRAMSRGVETSAATNSCLAATSDAIFSGSMLKRPLN